MGNTFRLSFGHFFELLPYCDVEMCLCLARASSHLVFSRKDRLRVGVVVLSVGCPPVYALQGAQMGNEPS